MTSITILFWKIPHLDIFRFRFAHNFEHQIVDGMQSKQPAKSPKLPAKSPDCLKLKILEISRDVTPWLHPKMWTSSEAMDSWKKFPGV